MLNFVLLKIQALRARTIMSADRVKTLSVLVAALGGPSRAARVFGYSAPSFLSQLLNGDRPITEKTVRNKIEDHLALPRGWLDREWSTEDEILRELEARRIPELVSRWLQPNVSSVIPVRQFILREGPVVDMKRLEPVELSPIAEAAGPHVEPEFPHRSVSISSNGTGKSSALIAVLKWHELAAEMIKHELETNEGLRIPADKAQALLQTLASLLMATDGKIPPSSVRDMINLIARPQIWISSVRHATQAAFGRLFYARKYLQIFAN